MWLEVLAVAFVAQLMVLPGEKGQFVVAGLSTRYHPVVVVSAAALFAFFGLDAVLGAATGVSAWQTLVDAVLAGA